MTHSKEKRCKPVESAKEIRRKAEESARVRMLLQRNLPNLGHHIVVDPSKPTLFDLIATADSYKEVASASGHRIILLPSTSIFLYTGPGTLEIKVGAMSEELSTLEVKIGFGGDAVGVTWGTALRNHRTFFHVHKGEISPSRYIAVAHLNGQQILANTDMGEGLYQPHVAEYMPLMRHRPDERIPSTKPVSNADLGGVRIQHDPSCMTSPFLLRFPVAPLPLSVGALVFRNI